MDNVVIGNTESISDSKLPKKTVIKEGNQLQTNYINNKNTNNNEIHNEMSNTHKIETELKSRIGNDNETPNASSIKKEVESPNVGLQTHPVNTSPNSGGQSSVAVFSLDDYDDEEEEDGLREKN